MNAWTELKEQRKELSDQIADIDQEIDEIQDALIEYGEKNDTAVICGDEYEATIRYSENSKFPTKSTDLENHAKLEQLLKNSPFWELVCRMDRNALNSLWKHPEMLDPELQSILKRFVQVEKCVRVGIRNRH